MRGSVYIVTGWLTVIERGEQENIKLCKLHNNPLHAQGVVTPIHAMNPSATGVKVKSKGQHPFPGEVKRSWCFCSFSQMVKTESKVKIPSAELVITTD